MTTTQHHCSEIFLPSSSSAPLYASKITYKVHDMPVSTAHASSSRRRTNGHTAPPPIEDDSADEAPVRNKGKGKAAPNGATRTNGADRSGEVLAEEGWTIDTFQSRPITKSGNVIATVWRLQMIEDDADGIFVAAQSAGQVEGDADTNRGWVGERQGARQDDRGCRGG
jgi:hypothetical protein